MRCANKAWRVHFYGDASLTTQVCATSCTCFALEMLDRVTSSFHKLAFECV